MSVKGRGKPPGAGGAHFFHICVSSKDRDESVAFYRDAFGFTPTKELELYDNVPLGKLRGTDKASLRSTFMTRDDGLVLEVTEKIDPKPPGEAKPLPLHRYGLTHLAFFVDNLDVTLEKVRSAGGTVFEEMRIRLAEDNQIIFCADPSGIMIELVDFSDWSLFEESRPSVLGA